jgi:predicted HAD superfamily phosphohydrolase YqeG
VWRRTRLRAIPPEVSVIALIARLGSYDVVVVDVDDTLVPDRASAPELRARLEEARDAARRGGVGRLVVVSNGSRNRARPGDGVVWEVNKPWTRAARLGISAPDTVAVIGDRLVPDGLLAWRWGADLFLTGDSPAAGSGMPGPPSSLMRRLLFRITPFE